MPAQCNTFSLIQVIFLDALSLLKDLKWLFFKRVLVLLPLIILFLVTLTITNLLLNRLHVYSSFIIYAFNVFTLLFLWTIITWRLWPTLSLMAIKKVLIMPIDIQSVLTNCSYERRKLIVLSLLYSILVLFFSQVTNCLKGNNFLLIFLNLSYLIVITPIITYAYPLIIIKNVSVLSALKSAYKNAFLHWKLFFSIYGLFYLLFVILFQLQTYFINHLQIHTIFIMILIYGLLTLYALPLYMLVGAILFCKTYSPEKDL